MLFYFNKSIKNNTHCVKVQSPTLRWVVSLNNKVTLAKEQSWFMADSTWPTAFASCWKGQLSREVGL